MNDLVGSGTSSSSTSLESGFTSIMSGATAPEASAGEAEKRFVLLSKSHESSSTSGTPIEEIKEDEFRDIAMLRERAVSLHHKTQALNITSETRASDATSTGSNNERMRSNRAMVTIRADEDFIEISLVRVVSIHFKFSKCCSP